ncbi:MAG: hypothetical protein ACI4GW_08230 [Lachnospiraceae bacterium]
MAKSMTDYTKILPTGKENAISTDELTVLLGFTDARALQTDISKARADGQIILSSTTGGYYLPANDDEVREFIGALQVRAIGTFKAIKSARKYLKEDKAQMSFKDITEDEI